MGPFYVAGMSYAGSNTNGDIDALWAAFKSRIEELTHQAGRVAMYGVARTFPGALFDELEYLAGISSEALSRLPEGMVRWRIPAQTYAVIPIQDSAELETVIDHFYRSWLPRQLEYEPVDGPSLEYYPASYPDDPTVYLYLPIYAR
jgi:predicted transcriptional regulator YdeE